MTTDETFSLFRRTHLGRALARARWTFNAQFEARIHARGFEDFRPSDVNVIARLPLAGCRITELAERAGVTKQAAGKMVRGLEERGYVSRGRDPDDGRAQRIELTKRGRSFLECALEEIAFIEEEWSEVLGAGELTRVRRALLLASDELGEREYL